MSEQKTEYEQLSDALGRLCAEGAELAKQSKMLKKDQDEGQFQKITKQLSKNSSAQFTLLLSMAQLKGSYDTQCPVQYGLPEDEPMTVSDDDGSENELCKMLYGF